MNRNPRYATDVKGRFGVIEHEVTDDIVVDLRPHPRSVDVFNELLRQSDEAGHPRTQKRLEYLWQCAKQHGDASETARWESNQARSASAFPSADRSESDGVTVGEVLPEGYSDGGV